MGLFDGVAGQVLGSLMNGKDGEKSDNNIMQIVTAIMQNPSIGGVQGLVSNFQEKGMGHIMTSWLESGNPLPISPDQIQKVLGLPVLSSISEKLGLTPESVSQQLSTALPMIMGQLSKLGQDGGKSDLLNSAMSMLGGLGKK